MEEGENDERAYVMGVSMLTHDLDSDQSRWKRRMADALAFQALQLADCHEILVPPFR